MPALFMPALSPTMTEGKLVRWLKAVGDAVRAGDLLAEVETDKAVMEIEAVDEGRLTQILIQEGVEGVAVNTPIAMILAEGEVAVVLPSAGAASSPASTTPNQTPNQTEESPMASNSAALRNNPTAVAVEETPFTGVTTSQINPCAENISRKFGRCHFEGVQNSRFNLHDALIQTVGDFGIVHLDFFRNTRKHITAMNKEIIRWIFEERNSGSNLDFDSFGGTFSDMNIVLTTHIILNISIKIVTSNGHVVRWFYHGLERNQEVAFFDYIFWQTVIFGTQKVNGLRRMLKSC